MRLSHDERVQIQTALTDAKAGTDAHVAAVIVPATDHYTLYPLLWGAMAAFLTGAALAFLLLIAWPAYQYALDELPITTSALEITDAWRASALPQRFRRGPRTFPKFRTTRFRTS